MRNEPSLLSTEKAHLVALTVSSRRKPGRLLLVPLMCNVSSGLLDVPKPMEPSARMSRLEVGAPGRMRNGSFEPLVTSRMKKLVSLPATSQVWAVNPLLPSCSSRRVGVSPSLTCSSTTGVEVPKPSRPPSST